MGPRETTANKHPLWSGPLELEEVREELNRVKSSELFTGASRLSELLDYIVEHNLLDPTRKPLAKTIAEDVYGRPPDQNGDSHNIVRVDAGRLRRRLAQYFAGPGRDDPIQIHIDPGGYVPRFELKYSADTQTEDVATDLQLDTKWKRRAIQIAVSIFVALGVGLGLGITVSSMGETTTGVSGQFETSNDPTLEAERRAHLAKSPSSLQAVTLSDQARNLIFPMIERAQIELALAMFRHAIEKDESYFGGYAGASQCLAALAIFAPDGPQRSALLKEARHLANQAEVLSPANSWTQSALSWVDLAEGDTKRAIEHADIALDLAPRDGNVLDFYAMVMLATGDFDAALAASTSNRPRTSGLGRFANKSIYGAASFHAGKYEQAIDALNTATRAGDPISAPTLIYLAAANAALGNQAEALALEADLKQNWPTIDSIALLDRLYVNPEQVRALTDHLSTIPQR